MKQTPLYGEHVAAGAKLIDFSGWQLPVQFESIVAEHQHTRQRASVFDCCHMGEFRVTGKTNVALFNHLVCSDVLELPAGRCRYGAVLNHAGTIVDDVITLKLGPEELLVVTNAGPLESVSEYIRFSVAGAVDVSAETAKIDIQGPASRDVLRELGVELADELKYFRCGSTEWRGKPMVVSRTGYTGELGYELFVANEQAAPLWRALLEDERVNPAGLGARDTLRLEVGYPLSGQDVSEGRTPLEAGLDRFIDWKRDFVGKEALLRERERGVRERLVGVETESRRAPRHGFDLLSDGETVGNVTSGAYGPSVGHGIGLAYVKPGFAQAGSVLEAGGRRIPVTVAEPPFYKEGTCRN